MCAVDVPLWIETEGAVQHVKDYIIHYKLSPPSALSSSMNDQDSDEEKNNEDVDDNTADNDGSDDLKGLKKRKKYLGEWENSRSPETKHDSRQAWGHSGDQQIVDILIGKISVKKRRGVF